MMRSVPNVLRPQSAILKPHLATLGPHFARISHLFVDVACMEVDVVEVIDADRSGIRSLEGLHIKKVFGSEVAVGERVALDDSNMPLLHTLSVSAFFTQAIAVKSVKSVTVDECPRSSYLPRCAGKACTQPGIVNDWSLGASRLDSRRAERCISYSTTLESPLSEDHDVSAHESCALHSGTFVAPRHQGRSRLELRPR